MTNDERVRVDGPTAASPARPGPETRRGAGVAEARRSAASASASAAMGLVGPWLRLLLVVIELELRQRLVSRAYRWLLGIFTGILIVLVGLIVALRFVVGGVGSADFGISYAVVLFVTVVMITIVAPAFAGGSINGDREAGTLATTQVTLVTTGQLVLGKFLAAWVASSAFLVCAMPGLVVGAVLGPVHPSILLANAAVLLVEVGFLSALGVGFSGLAARPVLSIVLTLVAVSALTIGSTLGFVLGGSIVTTTVQRETRAPAWNAADETSGCVTSTWEERRHRFDLFAPLLAVNPFIVVADATPYRFTRIGPSGETTAESLMVSFKNSLAEMRQAPGSEAPVDLCAARNPDALDPSRREPFPQLWVIGLSAHALLGAGALALAWRRTRTPARLLPPGTRVA